MVRRLGALVWVLVAGAASALAYPRLPPLVAIHWNLRGEADGFASRGAAAVTGPILTLALWALLALAGRFLRARDDAGRDDARALIEHLAVALVAGVHVLIVAIGVGLLAEPSRGVALGMAAFLLVGGNVMGRVRPNRWVGIRTPWTLADPAVWRRTHRAAGWSMVLAGALLVPLVFALQGPALMASMLGCTFLGTLPPAVYSWWLARHARLA